MVTKFMKCVNAVNSFNFWRAGYRIEKCVNSITIIIINFMEGAQNRTNI